MGLNYLLNGMTDNLFSILNKNRMAIFYGRPGPYKKKLILYMISNIYNKLDEIHYIDLKHSVKPDDLVGLEEELLNKLFIYWMRDKELEDFVTIFFPIRINKKLLMIVDPLYIQGGLAERIEYANPIFLFFAFKSLCVREKILLWFFIDTTVETISELSFFDTLLNDINIVIHHEKIDNVIRLKLYKIPQIKKEKFSIDLSI